MASSKAVANSRFMVNSMTTAGPDRVSVTFVEIPAGHDPANPSPTAPGMPYTNSLTLNMSTADGQTYFPGKVFLLNLTPE